MKEMCNPLCLPRVEEKPFFLAGETGWGKEPLATNGEGSKPGRAGNDRRRLAPRELRTILLCLGRCLDG